MDNQVLRAALLHRLAERQGWRCCYCGCRMQERRDRLERDTVTFEHIIPKSRGGKDYVTNLVAACQACNTKRGNAYWPVHLEVIAMMRQSRREVGDG